MTTELLEQARSAVANPSEPPGALSKFRCARVAASGGLVFFALFIAFATLTNNTPAASDSRQEVFTFMSQHHGRLQLAAALYALAMPAALLFLTGLFSVLRTAEGGRARLAVAALAGGILAAAATVTGALVLGVTATRYADLGPGVTRASWTMFLLSVGATLTGQVLAIGATTVISMRTRLFAPWFTAVSVVLTVASVAGAFTIGYTATGIQAVAGVAAVCDAVWILLVSLQLWRKPVLAGS